MRVYESLRESTTQGHTRVTRPYRTNERYESAKGALPCPSVLGVFMKFSGAPLDVFALPADFTLPVSIAVGATEGKPVALRPSRRASDAITCLVELEEEFHRLRNYRAPVQ